MNILLFVLYAIISSSAASGVRLGIDMVNNHDEATIIRCFQCLETQDIEEGVCVYFELIENYGHLIQSPETIAEAADAAYRLFITSTGDSLLNVLSVEYPQSNELFSTTRKLFNRTVYTGSTQENPSERAKQAESFLNSYPGIHRYWTSTAYRIMALDSLRLDEVLTLWTESCPWSPEAWLKQAEAASEDSMWADELEAAVHGLEVCNSWNVPGMPREEFDLIFPALKNHLLMRKAQALYETGDTQEALETISRLLRTDLYPATDFHSPAPFFLIAAGIENNTDHLITACIMGDLNNKYAGEAEMQLRQNLGRQYMEIAREFYRGPVFLDKTSQYLGDQPVPGVRNTWCDLNNDGTPDLITGDRIYSNNGDSLVLVTTLNHPCNGAAAAELNGDGLADIVTGGHMPVIWLSSGVPMEYSPVDVSIPPGPVEGIALPDWNGDGFRDVCLVVYESPENTGEGNTDRLYINNGNGTFTRSWALSTWPDGPWCGRDADLVDFDNNGTEEVFISNYRNQPNSLWSPDDSLTADIATETNTAGKETDCRWGNTIGSAWTDCDNDGDQDLFSANLAHPRDITTSDRSMLLINSDGVFTDMAAESGIRYEETHSYPAWADFDNDGYQDLYITSVWKNRRSFLYHNNGDGSFTDITWLSGTRVFDSWGISTPDINSDGRPDIAVNSEGRLRIFINTGAVQEN